MRAHGSAVQAYRAVGTNEIGLVVNIEPKYPASEHPKDLAATNRADAYMNRQFLDPALLGSYPEEMKEIFGDAWPEWPAEDFDLISQKIDFVGLNYYTRAVTCDEPDSLPVRAVTIRQPHKTYTENRVGGIPGRAFRCAAVAQEALWGDAAVYHREWLCIF